MPHCRLLDILTQAHVPRLRHTLLSSRAAHWGSSGPVLEGGSAVKSVAFAPNGHLVVAGMTSGLLRVWDTVDFEEVAQLVGHTHEMWTVAFSSDGSLIASGSRDATIRVWDGRTFGMLGLCEHDGDVYSVAFSPDNSLIASGSADCTVRIWNASSFVEVKRLVGHTACVTSVAFFPNGTRIVSSSHDGTMRMWDSSTYESLPGIQYSGHLWVVAVSPDSTRLALGECTLGTTGILRIFDAATLAEQTQVNIAPGAHIPWTITFSPDCSLIGSGTGSGAVQVWDAKDLREISTIRGHHAQVHSVTFSSDGSKVISGSLDGTVRIRPVASFEEQLVSISGHDGQVSQVVFSPDGSRIVSGSSDHTVRIWDGLSCEELAVLTGHEGVVWTVAYSPDGAQVISGSADSTVRVWDALVFEELAVLKGHMGSVNFVTVTPNSELIASCSDDCTVLLWSSSTFYQLARLEGHGDFVWSVAFSPDGTRIVSVSRDETVRVWDAANFTQLAELEAYHRDLWSCLAAFSCDGKTILTRLWDDGLAWVCDDEHGCEGCFQTCDTRSLTTSFQRLGQQSRFPLPLMSTLRMPNQDFGRMVGSSAPQDQEHPEFGCQQNVERGRKP
jgi:WD40 repeat protein